MSVSPDGHPGVKDFGGQRIRVNLYDLENATARGELPGVEIVPPHRVQAEIQTSADGIAGRPVDLDIDPGSTPAEIMEMAAEYGLGRRRTEQIAQRMLDMQNTRRDGEWLIKGSVPREYFSGPDRG